MTEQTNDAGQATGSDATAAGAAAVAAGAAAAAGAQGGAAAAGSSPEWMAGLSEDLRGDATLSRFASLDDLARGHIEAHKTAKSKAVPLPGDTDESRKAFADALRQQSIDAYDFGKTPAGLDKALVDGFREHAFAEAIPPHMAKGALDFYAAKMAEATEAANAASLEDVNNFKTEYGSGYDQKLAQVQKMIESFTGTPMELTEADLNRFDMKVGSANLLKAMFAIHDRVGDLQPAGEDPLPAGLTAVDPAQADATFKAKMADPEWRKKVLVAGSPEQKESVYLQKMIAQHRVSQGRG